MPSAVASEEEHILHAQHLRPTSGSYVSVFVTGIFQSAVVHGSIVSERLLIPVTSRLARNSLRIYFFPYSTSLEPCSAECVYTENRFVYLLTQMGSLCIHEDASEDIS